MSPCASSPPIAVPADCQRQPETLAQGVVGDDLLDRSGRHDPAVAQQQGVGETGRDLLDVVGDEDRRGRGRIGGNRAQGAHECFTPTEVQPGRRFVQQQELGVSHQGAGDLHPLALAFGQRAERALDEVRDAEPAEQGSRTVDVVPLVLLTPPADDGVRGRYHDIAYRLAARDAVGQGGNGQPDPRSELEDVHGAQDLPQDRRVARGRVHLRGRDLKQGGLAGAVGSQDSPSVALGHRPGDPVEKAVPGPNDRHIGQLEDVGHGAPGTSLRVEQRVADDPTTAGTRRLTDMLALPRSARLAVWAGGWLDGEATLADVVARVQGDDEPHTVAGIPAHSSPESLGNALGALRANGVKALRVALPRPGDPFGLSGPPDLNADAVAAGEAVLAVGAPLAPPALPPPPAPPPPPPPPPGGPRGAGPPGGGGGRPRPARGPRGGGPP